MWDDRYWQLSLKNDKPIEAYQEILSTIRTVSNTAKIEDLSSQEKDWLRAK